MIPISLNNISKVPSVNLYIEYKGLNDPKIPYVYDSINITSSLIFGKIQKL